MQEFLTGDRLLGAALFLLAVSWAWNMVYTSITSFRKESERSKEPFSRIDGSLSDIRARIDDLERRVSAHDADIADLHAGQSALCRGVQALLEHELHNGNDDEMRAASDSIGKWLRTR